MEDLYIFMEIVQFQKNVHVHTYVRIASNNSLLCGNLKICMYVCL